jgi:hypothetical protein
VLLALGLLGIAALFLPFVYGATPLDALSSEDDYRIAAPALLAVLVTAGSLRWLASGALPRLARMLAYLASAASAVATVSLIMNSDWDGSMLDRLSFTLPLVILSLGAFLVARCRTGRSSGFAPVMAMQVAYLAHAALFLLVYWSDRQAGAWLVLATAAVFAGQTALVATGRGTA